MRPLLARQVLPRMALMFLTRGPLPLEPIWRDFLEGGPDNSVLPWTQLFTIFTHPAPDWEYPSHSIFYGTEVPNRRRVEWGQHSIMVAERLLMREALRDQTNLRFLLASEACIPLWPRATVYLQALANRRSDINPCRDIKSKEEAKRHMVNR